MRVCEPTTSGVVMRRIVVTGMGAVTPLGASVSSSWSRLLAGKSGIHRLPDEIVGDLPSKAGGAVPSAGEDHEAGFDPDSVLPPKDQRKVDRFILFALAAAEEALAQAGWKPVSEEDRLRTATIIASGIGGFPAISAAVRTADQKGPRRLSPFTLHHSLLPRQSCGGAGFHPLWLQRTSRCTGDSMCRRCSGNRRCSPHDPGA